MDSLDMARLGLLVLNEGRWGNEQVIPAEWIEASTVAHVATPDDVPYGYLWWIKPYGAAAEGAGGQFIVVMPDLNMVVVITGGLAYEDFPAIDSLVLDGIRPAAAEDRLPENAAGQAGLEEALASAENAPQPILIALPEIAASVDGQRYLMQPNSLLWRGFSLDFSIDEASGGGMASIDIFIGRQQNDSVVKLNVPLDGSWALNDGGTLTPLGVPVAARGRWELDGSFLLEVQALNAAERYQHRFEFSGDTVIMTVNGLVAGQYGIIPGQSGQ
jgi:hypothetical protein